jgi:hypothetical protein
MAPLVERAIEIKTAKKRRKLKDWQWHNGVAYTYT